MTPEKQRIAIARACGLQVALDPKYDNLICAVKIKGDMGLCSDHWGNAPDYLNDLNAMAEAEALLDLRQQDVFAGFLASIVQCGHTDFGAMKVMATTKILFANAAQRADALLKTLGLWEDES